MNWFLLPYYAVYGLLDLVFMWFDRRAIRRARNIQRVPSLRSRRGGRISAVEWGHVVGLFQGLIYRYLDKPFGNSIVDIGCSSGLLAIAAEPYVSEGGQYTGIDIRRSDIEFCRRHYSGTGFRFAHLDVENATYAKDNSSALIKWPVSDASADLVTAVSVWTHLREEHAVFYAGEIARVLRPGGKAIVTLFRLDDVPSESDPPASGPSRFHATDRSLWAFDRSAYGSVDWLTTRWARQPEDAVGIRPNGVDRMLANAGLVQIDWFPGHWRERPGLFFQDIFVLEKAR